MCRKAFDLHSVNVFIEKEIEYEDRFCSILCPDTVEESHDTVYMLCIQNAFTCVV